jgi:hypothetical protein
LYCLLINSKYRLNRLWPCDEVNRRPKIVRSIQAQEYNK